MGEIKVLLGEAHVCNSCKIATWKWASGIQKIPGPDKSMWDLLADSELDEVKQRHIVEEEDLGRSPVSTAILCGCN